MWLLRAYGIAVVCSLFTALAMAQDDVASEQNTEVVTAASTEQGITAESELELKGPRDLFEALRVGESYFRSFVDGQPIDSADRESLLRVLLRLPDFPLAKIEAWSQQQSELWTKIATAPGEHRGEVFTIEGRVRHVARIDPLPEIVERYDITRYFQCELETSDNRSAVLYAREIPAEWKIGQPVNYRASVRGFFLKLGANAGEQPSAILAARRIAWHPATTLGDLGMDYGQFDHVRNGKSILETEGEGFYQMLAAASRIKPGELFQHVTENQSLTPLLTAPTKHHGELVYVRGTARRAVKIRISKDDIVQRFGFDHYYEVDVFVDVGPDVAIGDRKLSTYPFTVCVVSLPAGMPEGEQINQAVEVPAFFLKLWTYRSKFLEEGEGQPTPLLIGRQPRLVLAEETGRTSQIGLIVGSVVIVGIAALWIGIWLTGRRDREFQAAMASRNSAAADRRSLNDLNLDVKDRPTFPPS